MGRFFCTLVVALLLTSTAVWAKDEPWDSLQTELCERMLGHTLTTWTSDGFEFDVTKGLGARGFLGSFPEATAENSSRASAQGAMYWGHSMAVRPSVEAARAHDGQFHGLSKILYLISDVDVSDLTDDTASEIVQARFTEIFAAAELIYFDDVDGESVLRRVSRDEAAKVIHPKKIEFFTKDDRGPRFTQGGWTFPKMRGVMTYKNVFQSDSKTIKNILRLGRNLESKGYAVTFNKDFKAALNKARDQVRLTKMEDGRLKAIPDGSRYREDAEYGIADEGYKLGRFLSVEVWDPDGNMVAGVIGQRNGNIFSFDTIFYDYTTRDGERLLTPSELAALADAREAKSLIDLAKVAVLAGLSRLHEHGIDMNDAGMVTVFTASLKGVYVPGEEFLRMVQELKSRPTIDVNLTTPFSFRSLPNN